MSLEYWSITAQRIQMSMNQNRLLPYEIADFMVAHSDGLYADSEATHLVRYIELHIVYGTLMVVRDKGDIVAVCRWNMKSPFEAEILDLVVREDFRHKNISRQMFKKAKEAMPLLQNISFRRKKYHNRERTYSLSDWIKEKSWVVQKALK